MPGTKQALQNPSRLSGVRIRKGGKASCAPRLWAGVPLALLLLGGLLLGLGAAGATESRPPTVPTPASHPGWLPDLTLAQVQAAEARSLSEQLQARLGPARSQAPALHWAVRGIYGVGAALKTDLDLLGQDLQTTRLRGLQPGDAAGPCTVQTIQDRCVQLTPRAPEARRTDARASTSTSTSTAARHCPRLCWSPPPIPARTDASRSPSMPPGLPSGLGQGSLPQPPASSLPAAPPLPSGR